MISASEPNKPVPCYLPVVIQYLHYTLNDPEHVISPPALGLKHSGSSLSGWRADLKFWQEMYRTALGPPDTPHPPIPITPLLYILTLFNSLYHFRNTSHICQNRSIEFKQMSEGQTESPRASAFFPLMCHFVCVFVCTSQPSHAGFFRAYWFQQGESI